MSHEDRVARFYSHGVERYGTFHDNYLNFGLWDPGVADFRGAAEALLRELGRRVGLDGSSVLLDVACGMGTQDRFFVEEFGCERVCAIDLSPAHIAVAQARHALPQIQFGVGNACRLPFPDQAFSHVVAVEGIVHFDTREAFFAEARRMLRARGRLGVTDFFLPRPARGPLERALLRACRRAWHIPEANVCGIEQYARALERSGFKDVAIQAVSERVIPGYYAEQSRPEIRRELRRIRGPVIGRASTAIDRLMFALYQRGLVGYLIASAVKA
ncbi:MAG TPA: methyltransferase domain-containing protein [Myxococcota bacterium]|nr:methyltransferase domain-containing protein [Myxococcota bacterium]